MKIPYDYVQSILSNKIIINCSTKEKRLFLKKIKATKKLFNKYIWVLKYEDGNKVELAKKLENLRDLDFCFAGAASGWPPSAVFEFLREHGYTKGKIIEIMWGGGGNVVKITK